MQIVLCSIGSLYGNVWLSANNDKTDPYLELGGEQNWPLNVLKRLGTWILIFTNIIPISLMVTLELVKYI